MDSPHEVDPERDSYTVRNTISYTVADAVVQAGSIAIHRVDADQFIAGRDVHLHFRDGVHGARAVIPSLLPDDCPYPGLAMFSPQQSEWFFGRAQLVAVLLQRLDRRIREGGSLMVVGPSGAGKSSVLRAGLLPALARGALPGSSGWLSLLITPTEQPVAVLTRYLARLAGLPPEELARTLLTDPEAVAGQVRDALRSAGPDVGLVIIVDQLEELFTVCTDRRQRHAVLNLLALLAEPTDGGRPSVLVVYGLRADFYPWCADYPALRAAAVDGQVLIGPMNDTELREAILFPAQRAGLDVEPGLVELLLSDLGTGEAGRLPLLAHALRATWQQRQGSTLTVYGYRSTGGIANAVAMTAEEVFQRLSPPHQQLARSLFLRLVAIVDGAEYTRRRVPRPQLLGADPHRMVAIIQAFTNARLLTQAQTTVEITHEALLRNWPRLRQWIDTDREGIAIRQQLNEVAHYWETSGHDPGALYRGSRLIAAHEWAAHRTDLSVLERRFLDASMDATRAAITAERRTSRRLRRLLIAVAIMLVVALTAGVIAFIQRLAVEHERALALSRQLAAESPLAADSNPREAMILALRAWRAAHTTEARSALLSAQILDYRGRLNTGMQKAEMAVSPDGSLAAFGGARGSLQLWDTATHRQLPAEFKGKAGGDVTSLEFSPDGTMLATASVPLTDSMMSNLRVWKVPTGQLLAQLPGNYQVAWRSDGKALLGIGGISRSALAMDVVEWDLSSGRAIRQFATTQQNEASAVAYSPDSTLIAVGHIHGKVDIYRTVDNVRVSEFLIDDSRPEVTAMTFSDHNTLAVLNPSSALSNLVLWDAKSGVGKTAVDKESKVDSRKGFAFLPGGDYVVFPSARGGVNFLSQSKQEVVDSFRFASEQTVNLALSRDGKTIVTVSGSGMGTVWRRGAFSFRGDLTPGGRDATRVAFDGSGETLASSYADGTVQIWNVPRRVATKLPLYNQPASQYLSSTQRIAIGPDGTVASVNAGDTVRLWHPRSAPPETITTACKPADVEISPDGRLLAATCYNTVGVGVIYIWDMVSLTRIAVLNPKRSDDASFYLGEEIHFTTDGTRVLTLAKEQIYSKNVTNYTVQSWKLSDLTESPMILSSDKPIVSVATSPDGPTIATGNNAGRIQLWNLDTGRIVSEFGQQPAGIRAVAFANDGTLATGTYGDNTVQLWNSRTGALLAQLNGRTGFLNDVAFSPDGQILALAGMNGTIGLWTINPETVVKHLCQILWEASPPPECLI